jgi:hypothetical protein
MLYMASAPTTPAAAITGSKVKNLEHPAYKRVLDQF